MGIWGDVIVNRGMLGKHSPEDMIDYIWLDVRLTTTRLIRKWLQETAMDTEGDGGETKRTGEDGGGGQRLKAELGLRQTDRPKRKFKNNQGVENGATQKQRRKRHDFLFASKTTHDNDNYLVKSIKHVFDHISY